LLEKSGCSIDLIFVYNSWVVKVVLQRVSYAAVWVEERVCAQIDKGVVIFLGIQKGDTQETLEKVLKKLINLRIFEDSSGKMNLSIKDIKGEFLVVSQFTLCADLSRGNRPSFDPAAGPEEALAFYERFCERLAELTQLGVKKGAFGRRMVVELKNEGPATFILG
jgi:D-tyrosyl-tRNA(Tyr) deacylase